MTGPAQGVVLLFSIFLGPVIVGAAVYAVYAVVRFIICDLFRPSYWR